MRETAPCGLDSAPHDAAGWRRSTPLRGPGNFAAKRPRGMPLCGRGKFLLNGVVATRQGPRRQVARHERLQWGEAVSPKGIHANNVRPNRATVAGGNHRRDQGQGRGVNLKQRYAVRWMRISASSSAWRLGWHARAAPISSSSSPDGARIVGATTVETGWPVRAVRRYGSGVSRVATPHMKRGGSGGGDREL